MSAKIVFIILAVAVIGSSIGMIINLKNMFDLEPQHPLDIFQQLINKPEKTASPAATPVTVAPTLPPDEDFHEPSTEINPTPSPTPADSTNTSRSRSCYKVTINGKVYEECSENGDLEFHYED